MVQIMAIGTAHSQAPWWLPAWISADSWKACAVATLVQVALVAALRAAGRRAILKSR